MKFGLANLTPSAVPALAHLTLYCLAKRTFVLSISARLISKEEKTFNRTEDMLWQRHALRCISCCLLHPGWNPIAERSNSQDGSPRRGSIVSRDLRGSSRRVR